MKLPTTLCNSLSSHLTVVQLLLFGGFKGSGEQIVNLYSRPDHLQSSAASYNGLQAAGLQVSQCHKHLCPYDINLCFLSNLARALLSSKTNMYGKPRFQIAIINNVS